MVSFCGNDGVEATRRRPTGMDLGDFGPAGYRSACVAGSITRGCLGW